MSGQGPQILAIGGGKGGSGKSFVTANLALALARQGYRVGAVDLDLGAANLHTCLGVTTPPAAVFNFVTNRVSSFQDIGAATSEPNLTLFGGGQEFWQQVNPNLATKINLISALRKTDNDYLLLDLGAGTHVTTQDFFIFSHAGIIVVNPEPTSIENAYVFMKSVLIRRLETLIRTLRQEEQGNRLLERFERDSKGNQSPISILQDFAEQSPNLGRRILDLVQKTRVGFVVNQVRIRSDIDIGARMAQICQSYFGFSADFLGSIPYDDAVWKSVRNRQALSVAHPETPAAVNVNAIAETIASSFLPNLNERSEAAPHCCAL